MKRILIIDQADTLAHLLHEAFGGDHEAITAKTGEEALRKLEERQVDGVLVNLMTPVHDGAHFIRGLGLHARALPVVLASRESDIRRLVRALSPTARRSEAPPSGADHLGLA